MNQEPVRNCYWLVLGIYFTLKEGCESSIVGFEMSIRRESARSTIWVRYLLELLSSLISIR